MRPGTRRSTRGLGLALLAALMLGLIAAPAGARPAARTIPGSRWVRGACGDLSTWIDKTSEVDWALPALVGRVDDGSVSAKSGKARVQKLYKKAAAASGVLVVHTKQLGAPRVKQGATTAADYLSDTKDLAAAYALGAAAAKRLPTGRKAFVTKAQKLVDRVNAELRDVGSPLEPITANAALGPFVSATSTCQEVAAYFTPDATPLAVQPGDCYDEPTGIVPCNQGHDGEVFWVGDYPAAAGTAYPGENVIEQYVDDQCVPAFQAYVGTSVDDSQYTFYWYEPTPETWTAGDRQVLCLVANPDSSHLTGSVRNSVS